MTGSTEHEFEGVFCINCGADEASSFGTEPCDGFDEALQSHDTPDQQEDKDG